MKIIEIDENSVFATIPPPLFVTAGKWCEIRPEFILFIKEAAYRLLVGTEVGDLE